MYLTCMYNHVPWMLFPLTWAHFYSSTNSQLKENSYFLGHCSQKTNMLSKQLSQNSIPDSAPVSLSSSKEVWTISRTAVSVFYKPVFVVASGLGSYPVLDIGWYLSLPWTQKQQAPPMPTRGAMPHTECRALIQRHSPLKLWCLSLAKLLELVQGLDLVLGSNLKGQPQCYPFSSIGPPFFPRMKFCSRNSGTQHIPYLLFTKCSDSFTCGWMLSELGLGLS